MGSRMFLLLVLVLLIFTEHSQGVAEKLEQTLQVVGTFTDASAFGDPRTTANPINTLTQHKRLCSCKGKGGEMVNTRWCCQQSARRNCRHRKWKTLCERKENKNLKKCIWFYKLKTGGYKFGPSVPL